MLSTAGFRHSLQAHHSHSLEQLTHFDDKDQDLKPDPGLTWFFTHNKTITIIKPYRQFLSIQTYQTSGVEGDFLVISQRKIFGRGPRSALPPPPPINFVHGSHMLHIDVICIMAAAPGPLACPSRSTRPIYCLYLPKP